jgi:hypothetical protein
MFHYGDPISDAGPDRHLVGVVVAAFRERSSGKWRYVVEDDRGVQQTFSSAQLLRRRQALALTDCQLAARLFRKFRAGSMRAGREPESDGHKCTYSDCLSHQK